MCVLAVLGILSHQNCSPDSKRNESALGSSKSLSVRVLNMSAKDEPVDLQAQVVGDDVVLFGDVIVGRFDALSKNPEIELSFLPPKESGNLTEATKYKDALLWPQGRVPYLFDKNVPTEMRKFAQQAMEDISKIAPRIQFVELSSAPDATAPRPLTIEMIGVDQFQGACYATIGYNSDRKVSLGRNCEVSTITHELLHVLGMGHEHQRTDRDQYIQVLLENVMPGFESAYSILATSLIITSDYDYDSIMHYPSTGFSKNGQPTMIRKRGDNESLFTPTIVSFNSTLSNRDITNLRNFYPTDAGISCNVKMTNAKIPVNSSYTIEVQMSFPFSSDLVIKESGTLDGVADVTDHVLPWTSTNATQQLGPFLNFGSNAGTYLRFYKIYKNDVLLCQSNITRFKLQSGQSDPRQKLVSSKTDNGEPAHVICNQKVFNRIENSGESDLIYGCQSVNDNNEYCQDTTHFVLLGKDQAADWAFDRKSGQWKGFLDTSDLTGTYQLRRNIKIGSLSAPTIESEVIYCGGDSCSGCQ